MTFLMAGEFFIAIGASRVMMNTYAPVNWYRDLLIAPAPKPMEANIREYSPRAIMLVPIAVALFG